MDLTGRSWLCCFSLAVAACLACRLPSAHAATSQQINEAVAAGVKYLYSVENNDNWEATPAPPKGLSPTGKYSTAAQWGGHTALATYALLAAGEKPPQSPKLAAAIKWLLKAELHGTYAVALRSQVWLLTERSAERDAARDADARFLLESVIQTGNHAGFYGYNYGHPGEALPSLQSSGTGPPPQWHADRSNSQYGVLGVWALEQIGAEVPEKYWQLVDKAWRSSQQEDGSWTYEAEEAKTRPTMACAGIATLFITQDSLLRSKRWDPCAGGTHDTNIENGLKYVEQHIQQLLDGNNFYALYGVERIAAASGRRYFGSVDWFRIGANDTVKRQNPKTGDWKGLYGATADTSFAILFLSRGRAPVIMNKLQYPGSSSAQTAGAKVAESDSWNERPRDVANFARWTGPRIESVFNWQAVNLSVAPQHLHDAPILYISGNQGLAFSAADTDALRTFVREGGMILGTADCSSTSFSQSFQQLGATLFNYDFRELPPNHPILSGELYPMKKWTDRPRVLGLSNGVRELMILLPEGDLGRVWQTDGSRLHPEYFELGADIFFYAGDQKNLFFKGDPYVVIPDAAKPSKKLRIARIQIGGNWDPEPGGWTRLGAIFHNTRDTQLEVRPVKLESGSLEGYRIAHLTGTGKIVLTEEQREQLKQFVRSGGTLIVDAAGGNLEFADDIEAELTTMFGQDAANALATPLEMSARVFTAGDTITTVAYRNFARRSGSGALGVARLRGIPVGNRIGVFYSREDLSAGLVGEEVDGINGYAPASATQLMSNMILYARDPKVPAPAKEAR